MRDFGNTRRAESLEREKRAWQLRSEKGMSHQQIADELEVDCSTITKALKRAEKKHQENFMNDMNAYKKKISHEIELAGINALEQYYKSQKKKVIVSRSGITDQDGNFVVGSTKTVQAIDQTGDSRLLAMYFKSLEEIKKIWGFGADNTSKGSGSKDAINMTVDEKIALFCSIPFDDRLKLLDSMITQKPVYPDEPDIEKLNDE